MPSGRRRPPFPSTGEAEGRLVLVGEFGRAHGIRGEVRLKSFTAEPTAIARYHPLETEDGKSVVLAGVRPAGHGARDVLIARVGGVASRDAAEALDRVRLYVSRTRLPKIAEGDAFYHADLIGLRVEDASGNPIGSVVALHDFGAGDLLEIAPAGGGSTVMVAFHESFVPTVDVAAGRLVVDAPGFFGDDEDRA